MLSRAIRARLQLAKNAGTNVVREESLG